MKNSKTNEFTNLVFADWMLPGEWETREVVTNSDTQRTSYTLATKLHPNDRDFVDFWGNVNPWGVGKRLVFVVIHELAKETEQKHRWVVTTGRNSASEMTTNKFFKLDDAMKFAVNEMVKTTKKFDKINKRKTPQWDYEAIIANDPAISNNN